MIHTGAEDQCPVCGYSLERADRVFGAQAVEFTRVLDEAGALTHQERQELLRALEDLERNVHPIALCIYITDDGRLQEFRTHAHWVLNHARIHHPSFGRREKSQAIEDAELVERRAGERRRAEPPPESWWQRCRRALRDVLHPYPPPVRQEWMLMLVLDVQLEMACFTWGYMLDPYVNPDSINSCIMKARLQFRERAMTVGLKKVMKSAVNQIAVQSYRVNRKLRRLPHKLSLLLGGLCLLGLPAADAAPSRTAKPSGQAAAGPARPAKPARARVSKPAKPAPTKPAKPAKPAAAKPAAPAKPAEPSPWADDEQAEEVIEEEDATPPPAPALPPVAPPAQPTPESQVTSVGQPASFGSAPRWSESDYRHLLSGELTGCYNMLISKDTPQQAARRSASAGGSEQKIAESDTKIPKQYYREYSLAHDSGIIDPQHLFSTPQRADIEHVLSEQNAHAPYHLYVAVFKQGQEVPLELAVGALVRAVAKPGEYAALLMYGVGDTPQIEFATHEINQTDAERHARLESLRRVAVKHGGGAEGLIAAIRELHFALAPVAEQLPPLSLRSDLHVPLIPLDLGEEPVKEKSLRDKLADMILDPQNRTSLILGSCAFLALVGLALLILLRRRTGALIATEPDVRLSSPYGAGVSRNVRYLEGKEIKKSPKIF